MIIIETKLTGLLAPLLNKEEKKVAQNDGDY
jgi:hypothetical protein